MVIIETCPSIHVMANVQINSIDFIWCFVVGKHVLKEYAKAGNDVKRE
jgi:hypothetical protein